MVCVLLVSRIGKKHMIGPYVSSGAQVQVVVCENKNTTQGKQTVVQYVAVQCSFCDIQVDSVKTASICFMDE